MYDNVILIFFDKKYIKKLKIVKIKTENSLYKIIKEKRNLQERILTFF